MHVMIIGAAGMVGRKLTERLVRDGRIAGTDIERLTLVDIFAPERPEGFSGALSVETADLAADAAAERLVDLRPDVIFHLAAIVSGEAEADFEKGYRINLDGKLGAVRGDPPRRRGSPTGRASSSPPRSPSSARRFPTRSATSSSRRR